MWSCLSIQGNTSINSQIHLLFIHTCIFSLIYTYQYSTCISRPDSCYISSEQDMGWNLKCNRNDLPKSMAHCFLPTSLPFSLPLFLSHPFTPFSCPSFSISTSCRGMHWVLLGRAAVPHFTSLNIFSSWVHKHYLQIWKLFT